MFYVYCRYSSGPNEVHSFNDWNTRCTWMDKFKSNPQILSTHTWFQSQTTPMLDMYANAVQVSHTTC